MPSIDIDKVRFGSAQALPPIRTRSLGRLSFSLEQDGVRGLRWRGVEVLRGIMMVLRDENWGGVPAEKVQEKLEETSETFRLTRYSGYLNGHLLAETRFSFSAKGHAEFEFMLTALGDVRINRAGFTILHPVNGVAGNAVRVRHGDGNVEETHFPKSIAPSQPIFDIVGLSHRIRNTQVSLEFEGEVFEMEDQRNWSDASFKTYCRPLSLPFPYKISKGEVVRQTIRLRLADVEPTRKAAVGTSGIAVAKSALGPEILLATEAGWGALPCQPASGLVLRLGHGHECGHEFLGSLARLAQNSDSFIDAELVVEAGTDAATQLEGIAKLLKAASISPRHVIALPAGYLKSHQPTGPWPDGLSPHDCAEIARKYFPDARIGLGSLTNFTELNRCRPQAGSGDYITHGNAAIVHAADDRSVVETLESLPQIFASGWLIADGRDYRLGLVAIAMRGNPYGAKLAKNPKSVRKTMTGDDPRQKGLFGAAYAIGVAARAASSGIQAVALAGTGGPFGVGDGQNLYPVFHAVKALSAICGRKVQPIVDDPDGLTGLRFDGGLIVANCSPDPVEVVDLPSNVAILDVSQFKAASQDPAWLVNAREPAKGPVVLGPFACLFAGKGQGDE